jgi:ribonuclease HII
VEGIKMSKKEPIDHSNPENLKIEKALWENGHEYIACIDEAGRGPFAGPVVACAAIMPKHTRINRLTDSKKINKKEHEHFAKLVKETAVCYAIGIVEVEELDQIDNIKKATRVAMKRAIDGLSVKPTYILIDGNEVIETDIPQEFVIKGDYHSHGISAAAILAKTHRDEIMKNLDAETGGVYGWANNAGYETKLHFEACQKHGLTKHHRMTWKKTMLKLLSAALEIDSITADRIRIENIGNEKVITIDNCTSDEIKSIKKEKIKFAESLLKSKILLEEKNKE